jgi:FlgD Ig-like domain/PKD domain
MKKFITSTLIAACLVCWASITTAEPGGQPVPRKISADEIPGDPGDAGQIVPPDTQIPVVTITGPASGSSFPVDSLVRFTGMFTDQDGDTHTAQWSFSGITAPGVVTEARDSVSCAFSFGAPGIYYVTLTVTDAAGNSATATTVNGQDAMIVIYDRGYGFVSGKGRFNSPAGAYVAYPQVAGSMSFDFDARYRKDDPVPTGTTSFKLIAANLDFEAVSCNWFNCSAGRGLYTGTGTVNGAAGYAFLVSVVDGADLGVVDKIRFRIRNQATGAVVYDNQIGAPDTALATTPISNGDITVRLPNGGIGHSSAFRPAVEPSSSFEHGFVLAQNFPNPFRASTQVRFTLPERSHVKLTVLDVAGREIATMADGAWDAGSHAVSWSGRTEAGTTASRGVYFVRMAAGLASGERRFVSVRKMIVLD